MEPPVERRGDERGIALADAFLCLAGLRDGFAEFPFCLTEPVVPLELADDLIRFLEFDAMWSRVRPRRLAAQQEKAGIIGRVRN